MPESQQPDDGRDLMVAAILRGRHRSIVDIGAGTGKWGRILRPHAERLVAIEAWRPTVESARLTDLYDEVVVANVMATNGWREYDVAIFGDVLEHLRREQAIEIIDRLRSAGVRLFLTVPITPCPQDGAVYGNPYETHLDQWTEADLLSLGWRRLHRGANEQRTVIVGTYAMDHAPDSSAKIDLISSFSAANAFPAKLIRSPWVLDSEKRIRLVHPQVIPTNLCNLDCPFCSCSGDDRLTTMPWTEMRELLPYLRDLGARGMTITGGGEPLLYKHLGDMLALAEQLQIKTGLVTNGTLLDRMPENNATWIRVSFSDDRDPGDDFLKHVAKAVMRTPRTDWSFSYVLGSKPRIDNIKRLMSFANEYAFSHVRLVSDLLGLGSTPEMSMMRTALHGHPGEPLVIYQGRKDFTGGARRCLISLLKPVIGADGGVWPCCGVQYALANPSRDLEQSMRMCHWRELRDVLARQAHFDGSRCVRCYYSGYNEALGIMTATDVVHEEFV